MAESDIVASFRWTGGRAPWIVRNAVADGMERAAIRVKRAIRAKINIPYPPASSPGDPPHRRTGTLRREIDYWVNRQTLIIKIGPSVDAAYGIGLEFGTVKMEARPFINVTVKENISMINNTMARAAAIAFNRLAR